MAAFEENARDLARGGWRLMGKPTGFIEYPARAAADAAAARARSATGTSSTRTWPRGELARAGRALHGLRRAVLPHRHAHQRHGLRLPDQQPDPRVERPRLPRPVARRRSTRLHKTNNFPEFTGRVCPAPCEGSCVLGINEPPVTIKNIESAIIDRGFEEGWVAPEPPLDAHRQEGRRRRLRARPGLAAAAQLNQAGHSVTVFERADRIGGLLMYGIPNMKLDKDVVDAPRRAAWRRRASSSSPRVDGRRRTSRPTSCRAEFDAIVLCAGATQAARPRRSPGRDLRASTSRWSSCTANTQAPARQRRRRGRAVIAAKGKDVIVIGGGDTGTDCVGTSLRHGCKSLRAARDPARAAARARRRQPVAAVAEGLQAGLRPGGGGGAVRRRPAPLLHHDPPVHRAQRARDRDRDRRPVVADGRGREGRDCARCPGPSRSARRTSCCWRWASSARSRSCRRRSTASWTRAATSARTPTR